MVFNWAQVLLAGVLIILVNGDKVRYDNSQVFRVQIQNDQQLNALLAMKDNFDFWKEPLLSRTADVLVKPDQLLQFRQLMDQFAIKNEIKIQNVQRLIDSEELVTRTKQSTPFAFDRYHNLSSIYSWLDRQLIEHSNVLSELKFGTSFEGRTLRAVKLSHKENNPIIFLDANIHAREWISSAATLWILNELLTSNDTAIRDLAENFNWIIVPVINVDGFEFSHTTNRLWRKTRQPHFFLCYGADPNRNFNSSWLSVGASRNPCSDTFAGPRPFSEPESLAIADLITSLGDRIKVYLSFHSYGQYVLHPFGFTAEPPPNYEILNSIGHQIGEAIGKRYGTEYTVGSPPNILYAAAGGSFDWAYEQNITLSYTLELRDSGQYGFLLPANQIIPTAQETLDGFVALVQAAREFNQF